MAFSHVDYAVRALLVEAELDPSAGANRMERRAAAAAWRRQVRPGDLGRNQALPGRGMDHSVLDEACQRSLVEMLDLAAAASGEMTTGRRRMVRPRLDRAVEYHEIAGGGERHMPAAGGHPFAACGHTGDQFGSVERASAHRKAAEKAGRTASASSPAVKAAPVRRAASP
jgi:hypothetical protein